MKLYARPMVTIGLRSILTIVLIATASLTIPTLVPTASATGCSGTDKASGWVSRENAKPGTIAWDAIVKNAKSGTVVGWFDKVSAECGQSVGLHLSGNNRITTVKIYRMGYYHGYGARLVYSKVLGKVAKASAPTISPAPAITVSTNWATTLNIRIDSTFPTGIYMARFDDGGSASFAPFVVRDDSLHTPLLLVASTLTWQAYNTWGGWSLYHGPNTAIYNPARIVSFNRPYDKDGKSNVIYNEQGLISAAESAGLDISYTTDNDIDSGPGATSLSSHKAVMVGGHSEYWTTNMQSVFLSARDNGVNLLFFGGNQAYWRSRLENNGRNLAVWKSDPLDPYKSNPDLITNKWGATPNPSNQSMLLGALFAGYGITADYKVKDASVWPIAGSGLSNGDSLVNLVGNEVDTTDIGATPGVQTFLNSQVTLKGIKYNIGLTYYNTSSNAGVIDVSVNAWVCSITRNCPWTKTPTATSIAVTKITQSILREASKKPLGLTHPAKIDVAPRNTITEICDLNCPDAKALD